MDKNKYKLIRIIITAFLLLVAIYVYHTFAFQDLIFYIMFGIVYLLIGYDILIRAVKNILHGKVFDENFLMTIATIGAFVIGEFPEAVAVMLFYQTGEFFQDYAVDKSRSSIANLMDIRPDKAVIQNNGVETVVSPEEVKIGDILIIRAGEKIPVDGIIIEGETNVDMVSLTGESLPRFLTKGENVLSGSINLSGVIKIRAEKIFYESTVSKILDMVQSVSGKKAKVENFVTKFAKYYTPIVVVLATLLAFIPPIFDGMWHKWVFRALSFLVVSCPCALVISIPLGFFTGIGGASKQGILIKGGNYLELLDKANIFVFDKTGTLTKGEFSVQEILPENKKEEILRLASIAEQGSLHPIAKSIVKYFGKEIPSDYEITELSGKGVIAKKDGEIILCGNEKLMLENNIEYTYHKGAGTKLYIARNKEFLGSILIGDAIKEDAAQTIAKLKEQNITAIMLTGDNKDIAESVANAVGIEKYHYELLPQDKVVKIEELIKNKKENDVIAFVGDGINDAPALMLSDIGISMGGIGSDSAIEASDVVLMRDKLCSILDGKKTARKTVRIVKQNIIFALAVKFSVLILSALGITSMWWAVFADVGVSFIAILNSMRAIRAKFSKNTP